MPASDDGTTLSLIDRIYLGSRVGMTTLLTAIYLSGALRFGTERIERASFVGALVALIVGGIFTVVARIVFRQDSERVMWEVLPLDLAAVGALIWATGLYQDPFYPWVLGVSIAYAAAMRRRSAWVVSGLAAAVYLAAHFFGHAALLQDVGDFLLVALKAGGLVFIGWVVADATQRQRDREQVLASSQAEVEGLNDQLGRRLDELQVISQITDIIHSTLDFERVGPLVLDILSRVIDTSSSCVFVINKDKGETLFNASAGLPVQAQDFHEMPTLGLGGTLRLTDQDEPLVCTTVLDHKRLTVVFCAPAERLERLSDEDRLVLQAVASELVVGVENSQLYKLTKRLSITDELTGLFNYRYLQQRLDEEIERARRYGRSLSLLMLDIDDFKKFNDTYGHIAGDGALSDLGGVLRTAVREIDVVCRYGGEEFSVVLPETDAEGAFVVAEKVREAVADHSFADGQGNRGVRMTISIGLSTFPDYAADREDLLRQADDALYQAKHLGRDRVRASYGTVVYMPGGTETVDEARGGALSDGQMGIPGT